jgi:hypothetical protein
MNRRSFANVKICVRIRLPLFPTQVGAAVAIFGIPGMASGHKDLQFARLRVNSREGDTASDEFYPCRFTSEPRNEFERNI